MTRPGVRRWTPSRSPSVTDPLLIDPFSWASCVLYAATGAILADLYSAMERNGVGLRLEIEALLHLRRPMGA
jgi:hypothetical protein